MFRNNFISLHSPGILTVNPYNNVSKNRKVQEDSFYINTIDKQLFKNPQPLFALNSYICKGAKQFFPAIK
ncbi:hypothetical protein GCM10028895_33490 [Pontibacter rugosus]